MKPSVEYAGFWRRFAAAAVDILLFSLLVVVIQLAVGLQSLGVILQFIVGLSLCVFMWIHYQATPGKLLLGCQVVNAVTHQPLSIKQAALRYVGYYVSQLIFFLGFFWVLWDAKKQGFHDKMANSVVLYDSGILRDDESQKSLQQLISELR